MATRQQLNHAAKHSMRVKRIIAALTAQYSNKLGIAFFNSINDVRQDIILADLIKAIENRDTAAIFAALSFDEASLRAVTKTLEDAFETGGTAITREIQASAKTARKITSTNDIGAYAQVRFNVRNPSAEQWLKQSSSQLVTRITEPTRDAVQISLRNSIAAGINPREAALNIVGRINPLTGKREGGLLGLSAPQEKYVRNARDELSGLDAEKLQNYLKRTRRDKRFDSHVIKALNNKEPISKKTVDLMVNRYSDRLLKTRGDAIARSEMIESLNRSKWESYNQALQQGVIKENAIKRQWLATGDADTRDTHMDLDGAIAGLNEPFISSSGAAIMYPGDSSAPAEESINCRCDTAEIVNFFL